MQLRKASLWQIYIFIFIALLVLSLVPTFSEKGNSYSYSSCKEGAIFCSELGEKTSTSSFLKKGKGFPLMAVSTQKHTTVNGQTIESKGLQVSWVATVIDLALIAIVSLLIASMLNLFKSYSHNKRFKLGILSRTKP